MSSKNKVINYVQEVLSSLILEVADLSVYMVEIALGITICLALLYCALDYKNVDNFHGRKLLSLRLTKTLSFCLFLFGMALVVIRGVYFLYSETAFNYYVLESFFITSFEVGVLLTSAFLLYTSGKFIQKNPSNDLMEYPILFTLSVWFLLILLIANHLLVVFIGLVGFSLNLYVMIMVFGTGSIPIDGSNGKASTPSFSNNKGHEASIKYFYLSTFSTALILLSIGLVFVLTQTLNFTEIIELLTSDNIVLSAYKEYTKALFFLVLLTLIVGFAFKLSAFPSHFWAPEVYEGSSNPVTGFIIMPVKIATLGIFIRLLIAVFDSWMEIWLPIVLIVAVGSLIVGALGAFTEKKFKRFIAYSSINQMGFVILGLVNNVPGVQATNVFFIIYILTNLKLFCLFLGSETLITRKPIVYLSEFGFIAHDEWRLRLGFTFVFLSLAGIPPFAGFFGKFYILTNAWEAGQSWAVGVGILTSLISIYYYLNILKYIWFEKKPVGDVYRLLSIKQYITKWVDNLSTAFLTLYLFINAKIIAFAERLTRSAAFPFNRPSK